nr:hypothetical protein [Alcaligenes faecalis]
MENLEKTKIERQFTIEVDNDTASALHELVDRCTFAHKHNGGYSSHGVLDVPSLLKMLADDAAMVITRPGSWEGANLAQVLSSHGYEV